MPMIGVTIERYKKRSHRSAKVGSCLLPTRHAILWLQHTTSYLTHHNLLKLIAQASKQSIKSQSIGEVIGEVFRNKNTPKVTGDNLQLVKLAFLQASD
jgi:hypothetical protein